MPSISASKKGRERLIWLRISSAAFRAARRDSLWGSPLSTALKKPPTLSCSAQATGHNPSNSLRSASRSSGEVSGVALVVGALDFPESDGVSSWCMASRSCHKVSSRRVSWSCSCPSWCTEPRSLIIATKAIISRTAPRISRYCPSSNARMASVSIIVPHMVCGGLVRALHRAIFRKYAIRSFSQRRRGDHMVGQQSKTGQVAAGAESTISNRFRPYRFMEVSLPVLPSWKSLHSTLLISGSFPWPFLRLLQSLIRWPLAHLL